MKKSGLGVLIFILAAGGACFAQSQQEPSLGDLAKQRREEKKPVKVFTNEDVATSSPAPVVDNAKPAAGSADAASDKKEDSKSSDKKDAEAKDAAKSKDSPEVAELKQKLSSYKEQQAGWKQSAKTYEEKLATETSDFRRQTYVDALQGDRRNVEILQDKIDETQADLAKAEKSASSGH